MATAHHEVIPANQVAAQEAEKRSLVAKVANRFGIDPRKMIPALKATAFKQRNGVEVTDEQMMALLVVADQYGLNPWTKEIYAFFDKNNGIVPVVGVDGWARIINEHPQFNGMDFVFADEMVTNDGAKPCHAWIECVMHRKDREHPIRVREYLDEVYRPPFVKDGRPIPGPWQTHTKRFLRHKTVIQASRLAFGFVGIYDEDEAQRIVESPMIDVTPPDDEPTKVKRIGPTKMRQYCERITALIEKEDASGILELDEELSNDERLQIHDNLRSWERSAYKKLLDKGKTASCDMHLDKWSADLIANVKDLKALETAYESIQGAYDSNGVSEVPADVQTLYQDRKAELSK